MPDILAVQPLTLPRELVRVVFPATQTMSTPALDALPGMVGRWNAPSAPGTPVTVTYGFSSTAPSYAVSMVSDPSAYSAYTAEEIASVERVLQAYAAVCDIDFERVDASSAQMVAYRKAPLTVGGFAYYPMAPHVVAEAGDVFLPAAYANQAYIAFHEIGHALGLTHAFDSGYKPVPEDFGFAGGRLLSVVDQRLLPKPNYTYTTTWGGYGIGSIFDPTTPMPLDILALQMMYGRNLSTNAGDSVYTYELNPNFYQTIWDAAGNDTINCANQTDPCLISLIDGSYSTIGYRDPLAGFSQAQITAITTNYPASRLNDGTNMLAIAFDAIIENAIGGSAADKLIGNAVANVLDGGLGVDTLSGGDGSDTYHVENAGDTVVETNALRASGGSDTVVTTLLSYALPSLVENLVLRAGAVTGAGNALDNLLEGNGGANFLSGEGGADTMMGGDGNDTYYVDNAADLIMEPPGEPGSGGVDTVSASVTWVLGHLLENLILSGAAQTAVGNALSNYVEGNAADNYLDGGAGVDTLVGNGGNDTYYVDNTADLVFEADGNAAGGVDNVVSLVTYSLGAHLEYLLLAGATPTTAVGNNLDNYLEGNAAQNYLFGGAGTDTMKGGDGSDIYYVDASTDVVIEINPLAAGGTDTVVSSVTFTLGAHLEQLLLPGNAAITGIGNGLANYIEGNNAQNYLSGGAGTDTMKGLDGNDVYYVDVSTDVVIETNTDTVSGGVDFVVSTVTYQLGANVENLLLDGSAPITGIGSAVNNYIEGNSAANFLSGGLGADTMKGNDGNDVYYVDNIGDVVIETNAVLGTGGRDTVSSSIAYALGGNVEDLLLSGNAAIGGLGNGLANYITGNSAANALSGQDGADTLIGGTGTDTLTGALGADTFDFNALLDSLTGAIRDVITDFSSAQSDKVDLAGIDANSILAGDQAFSFIGAAVFSSVAGQLRFAANILAGDTDGNGTADFEIQLTGLPSLLPGDLLL